MGPVGLHRFRDQKNDLNGPAPVLDAAVIQTGSGHALAAQNRIRGYSSGRWEANCS